MHTCLCIEGTIGTSPTGNTLNSHLPSCLFQRCCCSQRPSSVNVPALETSELPQPASVAGAAKLLRIAMGSCARQTPMQEVLDFFEGPCNAPVLPDSSSGLDDQLLGDRTAGLYNLGNTCFMNTALQCLANLPDIRDVISEKQSQPAFSDPVVVEFHKLMRALWDQRSDAVSPSALRDSVSRCTSSFADWEQHDTMEFLEFLINRLSEGCKDSGEAASPSHALQDGGQGGIHVATSQLQSNCPQLCALSLFSGSLKTTITCPENSCGTKSAKVESITSVKLPSIDPKLSEQDDVAVVVVPAASSESPIVEHKVFVERSATCQMLLDSVSTKAKLTRKVCLCTSLEDGRLQIWSEQDALNPTGAKGPFLVYELETEDEALCVKLRSGKAEISGDGERRVCPDDGVAYTFDELRAAFGSEYSAEDLRSYWCDAMALAPSAVPAGAQSAVIVHCRLDSLRQGSEKSRHLFPERLRIVCFDSQPEAERPHPCGVAVAVCHGSLSDLRMC